MTDRTPLLGIDAVDIDRMRQVIARRPRIVERVFTEAERSYADSARDPAARYAVRFAAKEAVVKALGLGMWRIPLREVEVLRQSGHPPRLALHGAAAEAAADQGVVAWRISLTHSDALAHATVIGVGAAGLAVGAGESG